MQNCLFKYPMNSTYQNTRFLYIQNFGLAKINNFTIFQIQANFAAYTFKRMFDITNCTCIIDSLNLWYISINLQ